MKLKFHFDPDRCSGCGACAVACMDQNDIDVEAGQLPYRKIFQGEREGELLSLSIACLHCQSPACVSACPMHCLYGDSDTGLVLYDNAACIGCRACARVCPYGAPTFRSAGGSRPRERMEKCSGCLERVRSGRDPACVRACPTGALGWGWEEAPSGAPDPLGLLYEAWKAHLHP